MSTGLKLRPSVLAAKELLAKGRERLRGEHAAGASGVEICARLTDLFDSVLLDLFEAALADLPDDERALCRAVLALAPTGGYGRRDVAPYSDVDLLILHRPGMERLVTPLARRLMHDVFDVGLQLGHNVVTPADACQLARQDATVFTALAEARYLAGSASLFATFARKLQTEANRRWRTLVTSIEQARAAERAQFGETVYLLEPNVKKSRGGLRDIQLLRWIGAARFGQTDFDQLHADGRLDVEDFRDLQLASEFFLRLRNEMHFFAGKSEDVLARAQQVRLAAEFGYQGSETLLPVEQFMRDYFWHTDRISHIVVRFTAAARPWQKLAQTFAPLLTRPLEGDFRVGRGQIGLTRLGLDDLRGNLTKILRLCELANRHDLTIVPEAWQVIHESVDRVPEALPLQAAEQFLLLLSLPNRLGKLLRGLHECRMLEKVIPDFAHARCLLQFNEYHKYTVDEHCIRAVERACEMAADKGILGQVYRDLTHRRTLHLALLIHDLGKGFGEDHSDVGLRIAQRVAQRLRLSSAESETLQFLVHKHLTMSHLAFRRDTGDSQLIVRFAVEVGSPEVLQMLFLLTAADFAAVGPGVLNDWKIEVLGSLYYRTMSYLAGEPQSQHTQERRDAVAALLADDGSGWFAQHVAALPNSYLLGSPAEKIAADLRQLRALKHGDVASAGRYLPESQTVEYTVATHEDITPGLFHRLTGALTGQGLEILSADINTLADGLVIDRFLVRDPDFAGPPPATRLEQVKQRLSAALTESGPPAFRRTWQTSQRQNQVSLDTLPTVVRADNSFSDRYTIIDVFASDRMGLLYAITQALFELGLSVSLAKIGTHLDQVVDVFYVTDRQGRKVEDEARLEQIRARLLAAIQSTADGLPSKS